MSEDVPTCDAEGCDEQMPWDMRAIQFDGEEHLQGGQVYCSADHARQALDAMDSAPQIVTLHDPQMAVDEVKLANADPDEPAVGYRFKAGSKAEARKWISRFDEAMPGEWRLTADV